MSSNLYHLNDMVKIGCNDCRGCSSCCQGMGESILLDPYDVWQLETNLSCSFAELLQDKVELHVSDGLILPNLKMQKPLERCGFLNQEGRCGIHTFRPGLCRLFPLGRTYENQALQYFLLEDVCSNQNNTKIKIKNWLGLPSGKQYEMFLVKWHNLRKRLQEILAAETEESENMAMMKEINMKFLQIFYEKQYLPDDFYAQFEERAAFFQKCYEK